MSTLVYNIEGNDVRAIGVVVGDDDFTICLRDGRRITVPFQCYPLLNAAPQEARRHFELYAEGRMLHWPEIDEDIEIQHIVDGRMPVKVCPDVAMVAESPEKYGE